MSLSGKRYAVILLVSLVALSVAARGQVNSDKPLGASAQTLPAYLKNAGIAEHLNQALPLSAAFVDEAGRAVTYGSYFQKRPVVLALVYFTCQGLCPQVLHGMAMGLRGSGFKAGTDFDVVIASIDPMDKPKDAAAAKTMFLQDLGQGGAGTAADSGVHFLTGQPASIAALSEATGFHYVRIPGPDGKMDQFAHASTIMFATPDGRLSEYLSGIEYQDRDVRLALVNASDRKIASAKDLFLLYCCTYVPTTGKYTVAIVRLLGLGAMFTVLLMIAGFWLLSRSAKKTRGATA